MKKNMTSNISKQFLRIFMGNVRIIVKRATTIEKVLNSKRKLGVLSNPMGEHTPREAKGLHGEAEEDGEVVAGLAPRVGKLPGSAGLQGEVEEGRQREVGVHPIEPG